MPSILGEDHPDNKEMRDFRVDHEFPWIGQRSFLLNARCLEQTDPESQQILLAFEDITETS